MNASEFSTTRERTRVAPSALRIWSKETPETNERYDGISGSTQGERKEKMPAANATTKLTSPILLFEQVFEKFSRRGTVPFCGSPGASEPFSFRSDNICRRQSPSAVQGGDLGLRIENNGISQFQLLHERDRLLFTIFDV